MLSRILLIVQKKVIRIKNNINIMKTFISLIFMGISAYLFYCLDEMTWVAYTLIALVAILLAL